MTFVRLLVVEQTFRLESRDVLLLAPSLDADAARDDDLPLTLRFPDGGRREVVGRIERTHFQFRATDATRASSFVATIVLPGLASADVPPGTEVWAPVDEPPDAAAV